MQDQFSADLPPRTSCSRTAWASSPGCSAPARCRPPRACSPWPGCSSGSSPRAGSASRRSRTRSASPVSPPGRRRSFRRRWPGERPSTPAWCARWRPRSEPACGRAACTRAWRRCWTWAGTRVGAAPRRPSARTPTWSARSARRTCRACSRPEWTRRSSTSPGTPRPAAAGTWHRCRWASASSPTSSLPPFEMAIRLGGARAVMPSYTDSGRGTGHGRPDLLGRLLRDDARLRRPGRLRLLRRVVP
jgi:hypothetical protein